MSKSTNEIFSLFDKAISPQETEKLEFIKQIPVILKAFSPQWICDQFIPFLTLWIQPNNEKIVLAFIPFINQIIYTVQSFEDVSELIEMILKSDIKTVKKLLSKELLNCKQNISRETQKEIDQSNYFRFFSHLIDSKFDSVRSFIPSIISILTSEELQSSIINSLISDQSFHVRFETGKLMNKIVENLALDLALKCLKDSNSPIRSIVALINADRKYYAQKLLPILIKDSDWQVRVSIIQTIKSMSNFDLSLTTSINMTNDSVWQVKMRAYQAISEIVPNHPQMKNFNMDFSSFFNQMKYDLEYDQIPLKKSIIDTFLALHLFVQNRKKDLHQVHKSIDILFSLILEQPEPVLLHFINEIGTRSEYHNIAKNFKGEIFDLIESLSQSEHWRIREGSLSVINSFSLDRQQQRQFSTLCMNFLEDKTDPVRNAAVHQLAYIIIKGKHNGKLPKYIAELKTSDTFRLRQAYITLLKIIGLNNQKYKSKISKEISEFLNDECSNVVELAQYAMNELDSV